MCTIDHTTKFLGEGQSSRVYAAVNSNKKSVAVKISVKDIRFSKQPCEIEYEILSRLGTVVPDSVPRVYGASWCRNFKPRVFVPTAEKPDTTQQYVIKMQFFPNGDLHKFISQLHAQRKLSDGILRSCILDVVTTLRTIQKAIPSFRHNDLHLHNILVGPGNKMILYDFNLSTMTGLNNEMLKDQRLRDEYGIANGNNYKYDLHFFLNCIFDWIGKHRQDKYRETFNFLLRALPKEYRGSKAARVNMFRLKFGVKTDGIPSAFEIVNDPYFSMELPTPIPMAVLEKRPIKYLPVPPPAKTQKAEVKTNTYRLPPSIYKSNQYKVLLNLLTEPEPTQSEWNAMKTKTTLTRNQYINTLKTQGKTLAEKTLVEEYKARGIPSYRPGTKPWPTLTQGSFNLTGLSGVVGENFEAVPTPWGQNWESRSPPPLPSGRKTVSLPSNMAPKFSENLQPIYIPKTNRGGNSNVEEEDDNEAFLPNIPLEEGEIRPARFIPPTSKSGVRAGNNKSLMTRTQPQKTAANIIASMKVAPPKFIPKIQLPAWKPPTPLNINRLVRAGKFTQVGTVNGKPVLRYSANPSIPVRLVVNKNRVRVNIQAPISSIPKLPSPPRVITKTQKPTQANFNALMGILSRRENAGPAPISAPPRSNLPFKYKMNTKNYKTGPEPRINFDGKMIRCTDLPKDVLESIAMEVGLNPKQYKTKASICAALKMLHNSK